MREGILNSRASKSCLKVGWLSPKSGWESSLGYRKWAILNPILRSHHFPPATKNLSFLFTRSQGELAGHQTWHCTWIWSRYDASRRVSPAWRYYCQGRHAHHSRMAWKCWVSEQPTSQTTRESKQIFWWGFLLPRYFVLPAYLKPWRVKDVRIRKEFWIVMNAPEHWQHLPALWY